MFLELSPQTESRLMEYAAAEGINAEEYISRLLEQAAPKPVASYPVFSDTSDEAKRAGVLAYATMPKEEIIRRNAGSMAWLDKQLAEAANSTPEEIVHADAEWEAYKKSMNENRRITGERPLYNEEPIR